MNQDVTRRDAFKVLAGGAAGAVLGAGTPAEAAANGRAVDARAVQEWQPSYEAARRMAGDMAIPESNPACLATVMHCRSWSQQVYLRISEQVRGFVVLTPEGLALAAACQAAGRPIAVRYWGYLPHWNDVGRFEGAVVAIDPRDLPGESSSSMS